MGVLTRVATWNDITVVYLIWFTVEESKKQLECQLLVEVLQDIIVLRNVRLVRRFRDPRGFLKLAGPDLPDEFDLTVFGRPGLCVKARRKQARKLVTDLAHQDLAETVGQVALLIALHLDVRNNDDVGRATDEPIQKSLEIIQTPIPHGAGINLAGVFALLHKDGTEFILRSVMHLKTRDRINDDRVIRAEIVGKIGRDFGESPEPIRL